jgi:hypothetical protein
LISRSAASASGRLARTAIGINPKPAFVKMAKWPAFRVLERKELPCRNCPCWQNPLRYTTHRRWGIL